MPGTPEATATRQATATANRLAGSAVEKSESRQPHKLEIAGSNPARATASSSSGTTADGPGVQVLGPSFTFAATSFTGVGSPEVVVGEPRVEDPVPARPSLRLIRGGRA